MNGRVKAKFKGLEKWSCDRTIDVLYTPEPKEVTYAWTLCSLLHNIDLTMHPMNAFEVVAETNDLLRRWDVYDPGIPLPRNES